jgi:hypothetical protein
MTLQLSLPPELEARLRREAERCGQPTESIALRVLDAHLPPPLDPGRAAAVAMLERWMEEDANLRPTPTRNCCAHWITTGPHIANYSRIL